MASSSECSEECNRLVFEAVNESSVSKLRHVLSTNSENDILASFSQCNEKGENPLVVAIEGKIVAKELIRFVQCCRRFRYDNCHPVPLNAFDELSHQICIMEVIEQLTNEFYETGWLEFLAQVFYKSTSFAREDKIIALELIGALLIIELDFPDRDYFNFELSTKFGLQIWKEAMNKLRYFPADGEPLLPKIPYVPVPSVASSVVFGSAVEVASIEELNLLEEHLRSNILDSEYIRGVRRQSLLVSRRISHQANHSYPYQLYQMSLYGLATSMRPEESFLGDYYLDIDNFEKKIMINTYLLILEQITDMIQIPYTCKLFYLSIEVLRAMSDFFVRLLQEPPESPNTEKLSYANLLPPTKFFGRIAKFLQNPAMMSSLIVDFEFACDDYDLADLMFDYVFVAESISPRLSSQEKKHLEDYYSNYIRVLFLERTTTILHAAVGDRTQIYIPRELRSKFRDFLKTMVKHLLKLGASPNAINKKGQTPLHILAGIEEIHSDENVALFQALVDAGTHLDIAADDGDTVLDILKRKRTMYEDRGVAAGAYFSSKINTIFPLSCYCARVIRRHGIRFDEDRLPFHLQEFVALHSDKSN